MVKDKRITEDEPPIATIEGWEDGQPFKRGIHKLDRWALQSADTLTIHIGENDITLVQDPHSNYLGGYIWLTSIVFCSYLERLSLKRDRHSWISLDHRKRWVELGSGVGLIGIMLRKLGIEDVVITDIGELVETMERNVEANGLHVRSISGRKKNEHEEDTITVEPLLWNSKQEMDIVRSGEKEIDYIVACDCIYSETSALDLVDTMEYLASDKTTIICISEVRNQAAQDKFMAEAESRFQVELLPAIQWQKKLNSHQIEFEETLNLYRLRKPKQSSRIKKKHTVQH
ncbi:Protein-lysine methyltransferase METTL21D [Choanephora cucurbitarum]|uniref:Protein-lysine methyltransferase METTL21D n=1 Tax=Choanephora cucurbitarum TaxID=101091 RepID=A0A1C7NNJ1_9FUNG|nr:Protein-lysine methyltransferase METTL21D [Choanephora cucurbitarum]